MVSRLGNNTALVVASNAGLAINTNKAPVGVPFAGTGSGNHSCGGGCGGKCGNGACATTALDTPWKPTDEPRAVPYGCCLGPVAYPMRDILPTFFTWGAASGEYECHEEVCSLTAAGDTKPFIKANLADVIKWLRDAKSAAPQVKPDNEASYEAAGTASPITLTPGAGDSYIAPFVVIQPNNFPYTGGKVTINGVVTMREYVSGREILMSFRVDLKAGANAYIVCVPYQTAQDNAKPVLLAAANAPLVGYNETGATPPQTDVVYAPNNGDTTAEVGAWTVSFAWTGSIPSGSGFTLRVIAPWHSMADSMYAAVEALATGVAEGRLFLAAPVQT